MRLFSETLATCACVEDWSARVVSIARRLEDGVDLDGFHEQLLLLRPVRLVAGAVQVVT